MTTWTFSSTHCTLSSISSTLLPISSTLSPISSTLSPTSSTLTPTFTTLLPMSFAATLACLPSESIGETLEGLYNRPNMPHAPSMTTWTLSSMHCTWLPTCSTLLSTMLTPSRMLCVTLRTSTCAIRASSCVNLSSFLRASSRSAIPANFLRNFSAHSLVRILLTHSRSETHLLIPSLVLSSQFQRY